jgi:hypothetical protein
MLFFELMIVVQKVDLIIFKFIFAFFFIRFVFIDLIIFFFFNHHSFLSNDMVYNDYYQDMIYMYLDFMYKNHYFLYIRYDLIFIEYLINDLIFIY